MSMSDLYPSGPAAPHPCTCSPGRTERTVTDTLDCPAVWYETADGTWVHAWPPRKRQVTR